MKRTGDGISHLVKKLGTESFCLEPRVLGRHDGKEKPGTFEIQEKKLTSDPTITDIVRQSNNRKRYLV